MYSPVTHALHLVGGICGVAYVLMRLRKTQGRRA